jgi:hypothetical protein
MEITPEIQALLDTQKTELTLTFEESIKGLKKNNTELLDEKKEAQRVSNEAIEQARREALAKAQAEGDIKTVSASYDTKVLELQDIIDGMKHTNIEATKSQLASDFMSAIGAMGPQLGQDAMRSEYLKRIDIRDGKQVVLDPQGNLTALSIEDLNQEFSVNSRYSDFIKGTQAAGGGANGSRGAGGASKSLKDMTATEEAQFANEFPEQYKQLTK